jgi:hypothetical protein
MSSTKGRDLILAVGVVAAASFYRPLTFWAVNVSDLSSPVKPLTLASIFLIAGLAVLILLGAFGVDPLPAGLAVGGLLTLAMTWRLFDAVAAGILALMIVAIAWGAQGARRSRLAWWLAFGMVAVFGLAPVITLAVRQVHESMSSMDSGPIVGSPGVATGRVEDVVVVVVDSYPNLRIAEAWFGHEPSELVSMLHSQGFTVPPSAWSQHTFTSLSVSSMLQMARVIEPGSTSEWRDRSSLWRILRGDNRVARSLQSAGFEYTHIESGWDGTSCGPTVDHCIPAPWFDEKAWVLLQPTLLGEWVENRNHVYTGTMSTAKALEEKLPELLTNGSHDFVFAHFLLPHAPFLVEGDCRLRADSGRPEELPGLRILAADQMACVDRLLESALLSVDDDTALLLTGDHGSSTGGQIGKDPDDWSDADIAERFGVFMAYALPDSCAKPTLPDPAVTMAAILACALEGRFDTPSPRYLIGMDGPVAVDPERMARIQAEVAAGSLKPQP